MPARQRSPEFHDIAERSVVRIHSPLVNYRAKPAGWGRLHNPFGRGATRGLEHDIPEQLCAWV